MPERYGFASLFVIFLLENAREHSRTLYSRCSPSVFGFIHDSRVVV